MSIVKTQHTLCTKAVMATIRTIKLWISRCYVVPTTSSPISRCWTSRLTKQMGGDRHTEELFGAFTHVGTWMQFS